MQIKKIVVAHALVAASTLLSVSQASASSAGLNITEWMYSGNGAEFVELTNFSGGNIDFNGFSYDDSSRLPGTFDLSGFGIVANGESVIFTESTASDFRIDWNLNASVKVLGGVSNNIGRSDEINIYGVFDGSSFPLIDSLTYSDKNFPGTIRTKNISGRPGINLALGANDVSLWVLSSIGDIDNSYLSISGDIGSPGTSNISAIPVPAAAWLFASGVFGLISVGRRKII